MSKLANISDLEACLTIATDNMLQADSDEAHDKWAKRVEEIREETAKEWAEFILEEADGDKSRASLAMGDGNFLSKIGFPDDVDLADEVTDLIERKYA